MNSQEMELLTKLIGRHDQEDAIAIKTAMNRISQLKSSYGPEEISEILLAEGVSERIASLSLEKVFTKVAEKKKEEYYFKGVPKSYKDIALRFEKVLLSHGPRKFVKMTTEGQDPIIKLSKSEKETFLKLSEAAYNDHVRLASLHAFIQPSIIGELNNKVCVARKLAKTASVQKINEDTYEITVKGKKIEANINDIDSTNPVFSESNYKEFGFPDEYVIMAYEKSLPYESIIKNL